MTTIPDAAVEAAAKKMAGDFARHKGYNLDQAIAHIAEKWPRYADEAREIIETAIPHLATQPALDAHFVADVDGGFHWQISVDGKPYNFKNPPGFKVVPDSRMPSGPDLDFALIAEMLDHYRLVSPVTRYTEAAISEQAEALRAADNRHDARTVKQETDNG